MSDSGALGRAPGSYRETKLSSGSATVPLGAAGYVRVSTTEQARAGFSLGEQERRLREYIKREGMDCADVYVDAGLSGRSADKRPQLQQMLTDAEAGQFSVLVIPSLDRLARDVRDLRTIFDRLTSSGVSVKSLRGDVDMTSATGRLLTNVMGVIAEFESNLIGERVSVGKAASAATGRRNGGPRPFGYRQAGGVLTVVRHEEATLRRMRDEVLAGKSLSEIARGLNRDGITTVRARPWSQTRISQMLANSLYAGRVTYRDEDFDGQHTPIFSPDEWNELQDCLAARRRGKGRGRGRPTAGSHLFVRSMLRCGSCGAAMVPRTTRNTQGRVYELYACLGRLSGASPDCGQASLGRKAVDMPVLACFERMGLDFEATRQHFADQAEHRLSEVGAQRERAERESLGALAAIEKAEREWLAGEIGGPTYERLSAKYEANREGAEAEVAQLRQRERQIAEEATALDAEDEALRFLADLRAAIAGRVSNAGSIEAVRVAISRLFDGFTLHSLSTRTDTGGQAPSPTEWVRSRPYVDPDLLLPGGYLIEPHPRVEAILDADKEIAFPELHRVAVKHREKIYASARSTVDSLFAPIRVGAA